MPPPLAVIAAVAWDFEDAARWTAAQFKGALLVAGAQTILLEELRKAYG
jgi:hypothetical protein